MRPVIACAASGTGRSTAVGWLSRRFGMTADSLVGTRMATATSDVIDSSETLEPRIFWGLRGGGGTFGVVTEFRFKMHDLGPVRPGNWCYPLARAGDALRAYRDLARATGREVTTSFTLSSTMLSLTAFASGDTARTPDAILPFGQLGGPTEGGLMTDSCCDVQSRNETAAPWDRAIIPGADSSTISMTRRLLPWERQPLRHPPLIPKSTCCGWAALWPTLPRMPPPVPAAAPDTTGLPTPSGTR